MQLPYHDRYAYSPIVDRPDYSWPGGKRLAVYLGLNIEHFAFGAGEGHLLTVAGAAPDPRTFAWRDYGNRVGVWRCLELFDELNLPAAHLINTAVFDYAPRIVDALEGARRRIHRPRPHQCRASQPYVGGRREAIPAGDSRRDRARVRKAAARLDGAMDGVHPPHARPPEGGRLRFPDGLAGRRPAALDEDARRSAS